MFYFELKALIDMNVGSSMQLVQTGPCAMGPDGYLVGIPRGDLLAPRELGPFTLLQTIHQFLCSTLLKKNY